MTRIELENVKVGPANKNMKNDIVVTQRFTCCGTTLEKLLWEGWDWVQGDNIPKEIIRDFKYCPFCGKKIKEIVNVN